MSRVKERQRCDAKGGRKGTCTCFRSNQNERTMLLLGAVADSEVLCYDMTGKTILYDQPLKTIYMM